MAGTVTWVDCETPKCPACKANLTHHAGNGVPAPGDIVICMHCETALLYDTHGDDLIVRLPATPAEAAEVAELVSNALKSDSNPDIC
jgi:hypothetical protein